MKLDNDGGSRKLIQHIAKHFLTQEGNPEEVKVDVVRNVVMPTILYGSEVRTSTRKTRN